MEATKSNELHEMTVKIGDLVQLKFIENPCVVVKATQNREANQFLGVTIGEHQDYYWFITTQVKQIY